MAKSKGKKLTPSQKRYVKEITNLERRVKRAIKAGFNFPEDIVPNKTSFPKRITKSVLEDIKSLRGSKLYQKATGFYTEENALPVSQGIEIVKQRRIQTAIQNLPNRKKVNEADELFQRGKILLLTYNDLSESGKIRFIRDLSNEDYEAFQHAKSILGEDYNLGRGETDSGRETGKIVLPDEGSEYDEDYEQEWEEQQAEDIERKRKEAVETEDVERKAYDEQKDEKLKAWQKHYEQEKRKPKKERKFIYDGDAIYTGILARIQQFEIDYETDPKRFQRGDNKTYEIRFTRMLENEISIEGFANVMRRLDNHGPEIDTALEAMLYDSDEKKVNAALSQLAQIIKGRVLTQQESYEIASYTEAINHTQEDEDLKNKPIDELI